jgi:hypothetical protein
VSTAAKFEQSYAYPFASELAANDNLLGLRLATSSAKDQPPAFFRGRLRNAELSAALLLATSEIALKRFYFPPGMVARILRSADPVVTVSAECIRFESFSQCCGVYARTDMLPDAYQTDDIGRGTTNVDFNPPMRAALSKVRNREAMGLAVASDGVEVTRGNETITERKVALPLRWLKGFAEVQAYCGRLTHFTTLKGPETRRFLSTLPNNVPAKDRAWLLPHGSTLRISRQETKDGIINQYESKKTFMRHI